MCQVTHPCNKDRPVRTVVEPVWCLGAFICPFFFTGRIQTNPPPYDPLMVEDDRLRTVSLCMPPLFVYLLSPTIFAKTLPNAVSPF